MQLTTEEIKEFAGLYRLVVCGGGSNTARFLQLCKKIIAPEVPLPPEYTPRIRTGQKVSVDVVIDEIEDQFTYFMKFLDENAKNINYHFHTELEIAIRQCREVFKLIKKHPAPTSQFDKVLENRIEKIREVASRKAGEYAKDTNRYHNFDVAAAYDRETAERALWGMLKKHIVSVQDMINNPESITIALIDEKINDTIIYFILLEGIMRRRIEK